ncbi:HupE/UreJ family protein [Devosia albogilva]|uniref:HupE/UreJ family protein n=1 Tax=Devosia albogilva TaxID=429726 RepID=A0ABW5QNZ2_9HYPH
MRLIPALLLLAVTPSLALAHAGHVPADGFAYGFGHPLGGIDHVLAMVVVGVFAFVLGGRALWAVPLAFVGMMAGGFLLGAAQIQLPLVELGIAVSSIVIGAAAATGRPLPVAAAAALVGVFAVFHGHAHGTEMPADMAGLTYAAGFMAATALLHLAGIAGSLGVAQVLGRHGRVAARLAGGLFALGGLGVLAGWM